LAHKKGTPAWNSGKKMSPEIIEINRLSHTGLKASAKTKAKMSLAHKGNKSNTGLKMADESKRKMSETHKGKLSPERVSILQEFWDRPGYKERQSKSHLGLQNSLGFKHGQSFKDNVSKRMTGRLVTETTRERLSNSLKGIPKSAEHKVKYQLTRTNPERFAEWNRNVLKASHAKPNRKETYFLSILDHLYPNQYKYVGDGEVIIGGKNPDFININGQKKVIEFYGDRWHQGENPQDRIDIFAQYGFDCLIIWQSELLKKPDRIMKKIVVFHTK
jgi:hypothetical protein